MTAVNQQPAAQEEAFWKWLQDANIALALLIALPVAIVLHLAASAWVSATLVWYSCALALIVFWSRRSIAGVLRLNGGAWKFGALTAAGIGITVLAYRLFPEQHYCLVPHCIDFLQFLPSDFVAVLLLAPLFESIVFQGWFQTVLQRSGSLIAIAGTSAVFILVHLAVSPFLLVAALVFSLLRFYTRSLLYVIIAHVAINAINTVLIFY